MSMVETRIEGSVGWLTLKRPPVNILNIAMLEEIRQALRDLASQPFKVLVVESRQKLFSAGADVGEHLPDKAAQMLASFHGALGDLLEFPRPTLASVRGAALGGGCELALACDMMVMGQAATLGQPEIKVGVFPPFAALVLPRLIPPRIAFEWVCTGRVVTAERCQALGLANAVFNEESYASALEHHLASLTSLSGHVLCMTRRALRLGSSWRNELQEMERLYLDELMQLPDANEGLRAFLEKRAPQWVS